jgi:hypothetical protein
VEPVQSISADGGYFSPGLDIHGPGRVIDEREKTVKKILTALAITTGLLLTGCSTVDSALTLGEAEITNAELQASVDVLLAERAKVDTSQMQLDSGEALLRNQLQFQLLIRGFVALAEEVKIEVTNSEIAARRAAIIEQVGGQEPKISDLITEPAMARNPANNKPQDTVDADALRALVRPLIQKDATDAQVD